LLTSLIQVPGGQKMMQTPAKKVIINQDYGSKESWIDNWQFLPETYNNGLFDNWELSGSSDASVCPMSDIVKGEESGVAINSGTTAFEVGRITQTFSRESCVSNKDGFVLAFDYGIYNDDILFTDTMQIMIMVIKHGIWYLEEIDDDTCAWTITPSQIEVLNDDVLVNGNILPGFESNQGWMSWKKSFIGFPTGDGHISITLYSAVYNQFYTCYNNIKFYASSTEIVKKQVKRKLRERIQYEAKGLWQVLSKYYTVSYKKINEETPIVEHQYIKENTINGEEVDYDYIIGDVLNTSSPVHSGDTNIDNILGQFAGAIGVTPAQKRRDLVHLDADFAGTGSCSILCNGVTKTATKTALQNLTTVADNFVTAFASDYLAVNIVLAHAGDILIFDSNIDGYDFTGSTVVTNLTGSLHGTVTYSLGAYGIIRPSVSWYGEEPSSGTLKPLLELIGDEIAEQYDEAKQFNQMPIQEIVGDVIDENVFYIKLVAGWTLADCTLVLTNGYARYTSGVSTNNEMRKTGLTVNGSVFKIISIRYKVITAGDPGQGQIYYVTSGHGETDSYYKTFNLLNDAAWHTLELDMSVLTAGGSDWVTSTITTIRVDLVYNPNLIVDLDWIGFNRGHISAINMLGNIQDPLNQVGGLNRVFVINRGSFDVRNCKWELDLVEVGTADEYIPPEDSDVMPSVPDSFASSLSPYLETDVNTLDFLLDPVGDLDITVTSNADWTIVRSATWIHTSVDSSSIADYGTGDAIVTVDVDTAFSKRSGTIKFYIGAVLYKNIIVRQDV
jgi:hypothetical protein